MSNLLMNASGICPDVVSSFPSYCIWLPVRNSTLNHSTGLTEYWALSHLARLPTCRAESGSLSLCVSDFLWLPSDLAVSPQRPLPFGLSSPQSGRFRFLST
ncbi:hypothetical protein CJ419_13210 [Vibrio navarrensis]|nr:hypothetical protein [Vibrio navarrensis]